MKKELPPPLALSRLRRSVCLAATVAIAGMPLLSLAANTPVKRPASLANSRHHQELNLNDTQVEAFVRLAEPSVAELNSVSVESSGEYASSSAQKAQAARVSAQQEAMRAQLEAAGARILSSQRVATNGFRVQVPAKRLGALRTVPGVRSVGRIEIHELTNIDSVPWTGAPAVWNNLSVKGKGIKVGVIDTGIDYLHANFGGAGDPAAYAANDRNVIEAGTFPTAKVIGGYDFAGATYNANVAGSVAVPDSDPLDRNGHGSHVAGSAAGIGVGTGIGPGVAPEASLYALKVFGDNGGSTSLTSLAIEWAMDPNGDGDMTDHLDVINMSLGGAFGNESDPTTISANNAAKVGIIVVTSAGNEGPTPYVTGSPGAARSAISTAANTPGGRLYAKFSVITPPALARSYPTLEGSGPVQLKDVGPIQDSLVVAAPLDGCTPLTNAAAVAGNVVLIIRGACNFTVKYQQAQAAGARALVVYNSGPPPGAGEDPIVMGAADPAINIPGVMIPFSIGNTLSTTAGVTVRLEAALDPTQDDAITTFSSQGPAGYDAVFKPDISAPGLAIVSTGVGTGTGASNLQGTSMAAPHVAGAAALLRQLHPKLNQAGIKALLQNSTVNATGDTKLTRQGVGSMRVDRAAALSSFASPGGVTFGRLNPLLPIWQTEKIELTNLKNGVRNYSVRHVPNRTLPGVQVSCPSHVSVGSKRSAKAYISLKFDPRDSWDAGVADDAIVSQTEVDGWCIFNDGKDELRVGYIAVVDPASSVFVTPTLGLKKVTVRNLGPSLGWAEAFTLAKLGGEELNGVTNAIAAVGFRRADPALYGIDVLEFGVATERPFTHVSNLIFDIFIDFNKDGTPDAELLAIDLSLLDPTVDPGTYVTAQFLPSGAGFLDWEVRSWDFNDRTAILPFTLQSSDGLAPDTFDYTMIVANLSDDSEDVQHGTVDLTKEIVPDVNSFGVEPRDKVDVTMSGGSGVSLWLFQNNVASGQVGAAFTK
jgi:subtilisin family serine protease